MKIKQAIIFRQNLLMSPGKMAAQACHAAIGAFERADLDTVQAWRRNGETKVVLSVADEQALHDLHAAAIGLELPAYLVRDEGRTEITPGSLTALAIGPGYIDPVTSHLPLWTSVGLSIQPPRPGICTREKPHSGPCNGLETAACDGVPPSTQWGDITR